MITATRYIKRALHDLTQVKEYTDHLRLGICTDALCPHLRRSDVRALFISWEHFSGNVTYPVPHPTLDPEEAFDTIKCKYNKNTQYGRMRLDLVDHCIKQLTTYLEKTNGILG